MLLYADLHAQRYADPTRSMENGKAPGLKVKVLSTAGGTKTYILIFTKGDELVAGLTEFAITNNIKSGHYTWIGDALAVKAGWFDYQRKKLKLYQLTPPR